jgi:pimeloyl-ACP methyl ester carboxylesterase
LARVWWPTEKPAGIVLLLGDVLTHERSWDALRPPGAYVCIAPSFRRGPSWESVDGLVAAAVKAAGLEPGRLYMFAHGVGARDGLKQAAKEPARFGAVAAVAPLSDQPLTSIPKAFPPFLLMEAGKDGLIPEESLRRVGLVLERRLEKFEYAALPGVDHETAKGPALAKSLEFFRAIAAGEWKRPQ